MMKRKTIAVLLLIASSNAVTAQQSHYHRALNSEAENARYGLTQEPHFQGSGMYWSRVRDIDDVPVARESVADSLARVNEFKRLCNTAYAAFDAGNDQATIIYGDSALRLHYHTPDLYFFMAISSERLGYYDDAKWAYKKAKTSGYYLGAEAYAAFKKRMKEHKKNKNQ